MIEGYLPIGKGKADFLELGCNINPNGLIFIIRQKLEKIPISIRDTEPKFFYIHQGFLDTNCGSCIQTVKDNCMETLLKKYINTKNNIDK